MCKLPCCGVVMGILLSQPQHWCGTCCSSVQKGLPKLQMYLMCCVMLCPCRTALQELRKASGQQLREVQVGQGEAIKQLQDERQQAERKEAQLRVSTSQTAAGGVEAHAAAGYVFCPLRGGLHPAVIALHNLQSLWLRLALSALCCTVRCLLLRLCWLQADNEQLEASLTAANAQVAKLQAQLSSLSELQEGLQASLQGKQSAEASLMAQLTQVRALEGRRPLASC